MDCWTIAKLTTLLPSLGRSTLVAPGHVVCYTDKCPPGLYIFHLCDKSDLFYPSFVADSKRHPECQVTQWRRETQRAFVTRGQLNETFTSVAINIVFNLWNDSFSWKIFNELGSGVTPQETKLIAILKPDFSVSFYSVEVFYIRNNRRRTGDGERVKRVRHMRREYKLSLPHPGGRGTHKKWGRLVVCHGAMKILSLFQITKC